MARPKKILKSRTVELRLQIAVEVGSREESLLNYLNNDNVRPFSKSQMFMTALLPFWQSLVALHQQQPLEKVIKSLENSRYLWELHEQYLRRHIEAQEIKQSSLQLVVKSEPGEPGEPSELGEQEKHEDLSEETDTPQQ